MINKEENVVNLNINFKLNFKVIRRDQLSNVSNVSNGGEGIYNQLKKGGTRVISKEFTTKMLEDCINDLYNKNLPSQRNIKIITNQAGYNMFKDALDREINKKKTKLDDRKTIRIRSKIFKQIDKC